MTGRDRMRALFNGEHVDRIPNGLGGCETAGLHMVAYQRLKRVLGIDDTDSRFYTFMCNAVFELSVLDAMGADMIIANSSMCPSDLWGENISDQWKEVELWGSPVQVPVDWRFERDSDGAWWWDERSKCPPGGYYFDVPPEVAARERTSMDPNPSPDSFHPSHRIDEGQLRRAERGAQWLHDHTDYSVVCGETVHDLQHCPGGRQEWWMRMISEPAAVHQFLDKMVDAALAQLKELDQAVGSYCDSLLIAHDMGDARGVAVGPELWREIYKPHYKRLFAGWHATTNMKVIMHNCGAIAEILDDLIECGVDVINPVQISAGGMDPAELKRRFGGRIILYGGAYDAILMAQETSEERVYEAVRANIETLSAGGGYIFAGVHNLPADMPESHLRAMLAAYRDSARYRGMPA
jgi:uroporphyrinogen decarboxylase